MQLCNYTLVSTAIIKCYAIKTRKTNRHEVLYLLRPNQYNLPPSCEF